MGLRGCPKKNIPMHTHIQIQGYQETVNRLIPGKFRPSPREAGDSGRRGPLGHLLGKGGGEKK